MHLGEEDEFISKAAQAWRDGAAVQGKEQSTSMLRAAVEASYILAISMRFDAPLR
jgi:hypothetical protein